MLHTNHSEALEFCREIIWALLSIGCAELKLASPSQRRTLATTSPYARTHLHKDVVVIESVVRRHASDSVDSKHGEAKHVTLWTVKRDCSDVVLELLHDLWRHVAAHALGQ